MVVGSTEHDVAIEQLPMHIGLAHVGFHRRGTRTEVELLQPARDGTSLRLASSRIIARHGEDATSVREFEGVRINQQQLGDPDPRENFGDR
jgi:hypothetical protein